MSSMSASVTSAIGIALKLMSWLLSYVELMRRVLLLRVIFATYSTSTFIAADDACG